MLIGMILTVMTDQVLNETLTEEPYFNLHDGAALARRFFNRTTVIDGIPIYVDGVGERRVDMDIKQFNRASGEFEVINTKHVIKIDHTVMVAAQFVHETFFLLCVPCIIQRFCVAWFTLFFRN